VHYRLPDQPVPAAVREALDWVHQSLAGTTRPKPTPSGWAKFCGMNLKESAAANAGVGDAEKIYEPTIDRR